MWRTPTGSEWWRKRLTLSQDVQPRVETDPATRNRYLRVNALAGPLKLAYGATVDLSHHIAEPAQIGEVPVARLPAQVLSYIYPSRYCQSDRLHRLAMREFGQQWQGYSRVQAIRDWVLQRTTFLVEHIELQHLGDRHAARDRRACAATSRT